MLETYHGGCHCGRVRFRIRADLGTIYPLAPRSPLLPWGPVRVSFLGSWPARWWRRCIATELLREFRRQPAHLGEDLA